jgi:hypothetical protein
MGHSPWPHRGAEPGQHKSPGPASQLAVCGNASFAATAQGWNISRYIRPRVQGASVVFPVTLADRHPQLLVEQIGALRAAVRETRTERPFRIDAWGACLTTFTQSGPCRRTTRTARSGGKASRPGSPNPWARPGGGVHQRSPRARRGFGSDDSGSTIFGTNAISPRICGIAGGTRSSMVSSNGPSIGRIR